jgi:hypothetical protein
MEVQRWRYTSNGVASSEGRWEILVASWVFAGIAGLPQPSGSKASHLRSAPLITVFVISTPAISPGISAPASYVAPPVDPNVRLQVLDREPLSRSATRMPLRCMYGSLIYLIQGCGSYGTSAFCGPRSTRRYGHALRKYESVF